MSTDPRVAIVTEWAARHAAESIVVGGVTPEADAKELLVRLDAIGDRVERVAKAIHDADCPHGANEPTWPGHVDPYGVGETYRRLARAALGAIA